MFHLVHFDSNVEDMIHQTIYSTSNGLLKRRFYFQIQSSFSSMSRRRTHIELEEIPNLKQAYEERIFSPRNLKRAATLTRKYEHNEEFNRKISLIQADITKLKIDAIVNAANETLLGGGGVDGAIHRAAGPELRHECWELNGCDTGDAKITKGYDLPSKHVIHTVGPVGEKQQLLRNAYERSMQVMCENNLKSVAFSNISTGVYGYPRGKAGHVALDTIRKWLEKSSDYLDKLDRIIFCVFEDENKDVYETLLPIYFPPPADIEIYEKEEEKSKSKANEDKKDSEAEKDKDHTTLTTEQVSNKEIIDINNKKVKEKVEEGTHTTLTTGLVSDKEESADKGTNAEKGASADKGSNADKGASNDEESSKDKEPSNDDKDKEPSNDDKDKEPSNDDKDKEPSNDDKNKEPSNDDKDKEPSNDDKDKEPSNDDKDKEPSNDDKDKEPSNDDKDKEPSNDEKSSNDKEQNNNKESRENVGEKIEPEKKDDSQDNNNSTDPGENGEPDTDMARADVEDPDTEMPDAETETDKNKTSDDGMSINEQNSKKRPHDSVETEQPNKGQDNITNGTTTENAGQQVMEENIQDGDVVMGNTENTGQDFKSTDVFSTVVNPPGQNKPNQETNTDEDIKEIEAEQTDNTSLKSNNSKI
ncbi:hypothetical protein RclHR1_02150025 [Rhizophagus clarus]|uniref:O-acetyl-ADP-ribose deacetylase MACROD1-like isoform X1 n=1 Tax=Rhizophagus clarus TaxID=94130 RepID=A0A2Z6RM59_9GLOM|nr:hypothetical protein RclHR1_02150025 [Rhizophagus clarus]GET03419.1 O-acetyl-ADP-ribose deacetylase MACROD1-like isoform X1 [Rhizophagus clarus]